MIARDELLSTAEAARILGVGRHVVHRLRRKGKIECVSVRQVGSDAPAYEFPKAEVMRIAKLRRALSELQKKL